MSYIDINAYNCTCERCSHTWSTFKLPLTCAKCRSPYWDIAKGAVNKPVADFPIENKKNSAASPNFKDLVDKKLHPERTDEERKHEIDSLKSLVDKTNYKTKSVIDTWPTRPLEDQPDYYNEPTIE